MKYVFNRINEHLERTFESAIQQGFSSTFCISNGRESGKYQGLYSAQTAQRFDRKLPRNLPLLIQFTSKTKEKVDFTGTLNDLDHVLKNSDIFLISCPQGKGKNRDDEPDLQ